MKGNSLQTLLLIILIGLIAYNTYENSLIKTDVDSYLQKIDSIQTEIDSATAYNQELDSKISKVDTSIVKITNEIKMVDKNIINIKKITDEKINGVDGLSDSELVMFFTNRYYRQGNTK